MPIFDENNFVSSKRFQYKPIQFQFTFKRINHNVLKLQISVKNNSKTFFFIKPRQPLKSNTL